MFSAGGNGRRRKDPEAKFIVPTWGDKVDSDIGLSYWPARLQMLEGWYDNPLALVNFIPQFGTMNSATSMISALIVQTISL